MKVLLSTLNAKYIHSSLALRYLREFCHSTASITVKEFSINNKLSDILSVLYAEQPAVVGLACYIWNIDMTLDLVDLLRKVLPDVVIVLGGPEVSYDAADIMTAHPAIDYIIQGEGEQALQRLLICLQEKSQPVDIDGLLQCSNDALSGSRPAIVKQLDRLAFPYRDEEIIELKDKIIYYESSRGCPFCCQYCLSSATAGVRFFSIERVIEELAFFIRHDVKQVKFVDRTFNAKKAHYLPLLHFIARQQGRTNFHFEIAADLLDEETLTVLKSMPVGRVQLEIGVQSTHVPTLAAIQRTNHWDKITHAVTEIVAAGNMHIHLDLIVGLPHEGWTQFAKSFNDVYALKPHMLQIGFLKLLKGAGLRTNAHQHGYIFMDKAPYQVLGNDYLSYGEVRRLHIIEEFFEHTYNSGRFSHTLQYFVSLYGGDAFAFYSCAALFWERQAFHLVAHSTKTLYTHLLEFCRQQHPASLFVCAQLLKLDALLSDYASIRPEGIAWNCDEWNARTSIFWRNTELVRQYLGAYQFTTWRDLKKKYHIEVFPIDIAVLITDGEVIERPTALLFVLGKDRWCSQYQTIDSSHFFEQEVK